MTTVRHITEADFYGTDSFEDLDAWLAGFAATISEQQLYREPTEVEAEDFIAGLYSLISGDETDQRITDLGFTISGGCDDDSKKHYVLVENETGTDRSWGVYILPKEPITMIIEVPHPVADTNTEVQGLDLWRKIPGAMLIIAGCERSVGESQDGSGLADVSWNAGSLFHRVAAELVQYGYPQVQIHGYADSSDPDHDIILSMCSANDQDPLHFMARSYQSAGFRTATFWDDSEQQLTAFGNVQGEVARQYGTHMLHIEQNYTVRTSEALRILSDSIIANSNISQLASYRPMFAQSRTGQWPLQIGSGNSSGDSYYTMRSDARHRLTENDPVDGEYVKRDSGTWQSVETSEMSSGTYVTVGASNSDYLTGDYANDSACIQQAIDDAAVNDGGTIFIRNGRYYLPDPISIPKDSYIRLVGEQMARTTVNGVLLSATTTMDSMFEYAGLSNPTSNADLAHYIEFEDIGFNGANNATNIFKLTNTDTVKFRRCRFVYATTSIKTVWDSTSDPVTETLPGGLYVDECIVSSIGGVAIDLQYQTQCWITRNWFSGSNVQKWINYHASNKVRVTGNEFNTGAVAHCFQDTSTYPTHHLILDGNTYTMASGQKAWKEERTHANSDRVSIMGGTMTGGVTYDTLVGTNNQVLVAGM